MNLNYDEARYNRQNRTNPAANPPGQDANTTSAYESLSNGDDIFQTQAQPVSNTGLGQSDLFSTSLNPDGMASANGQMVQPQQQQPQRDWFDVFSTCAKAFWSNCVSLGKAFDDITSQMWRTAGRYSLAAGLVYIIVGIILAFVGYDKALYLSASGCFTIASGTTLLFTLGNSKSMYKTESNSITADEAYNDTTSDVASDSFTNGNNFDSSWGDDTGSSWDAGDDWDDTYGEDYDGDPYSDEEPYEEDSDFEYDFDSSLGNSEVAGESVESALSSLQSIPAGMYTRQYLYDAFTKVLPMLEPNFRRVEKYDDSVDVFYEWEERLREAAAVVMGKDPEDEDLPELQLVEESLFIIVLTCSRCKGCKPELIADELARIYSYKDGEFDPKVYAQSDTVGMSFHITLFTGRSAMISLKDMMAIEEKYILDAANNYIPVVLGVDQKGKVIAYDFKKLESVLITGMPRSGKSWFVQCVLAQMCAFVSPKELNIYICDPKDKISDFRQFNLPHVKRFEHKDEKILETLRYLVKVEANRRRNIIGDEEDVNIWDFKKKNPDVHLPVIYVVIDEIVTLASRMDKETGNEFRMLLRELISQLPALGIRAFLIPHVLNNDIIEKKTSDLIPLRISVCGDEAHIERVTGSKPKDFAYKLTNPGDMAVRMPAVSAKTMFIHGPAVTKTNEGNREVFEYMRKVWGMLEPSEVENSVAATAKANEESKNLLKSYSEKIKDDDDDDGLFDNAFSEDDSSSTAFKDFVQNLF